MRMPPYRYCAAALACALCACRGDPAGPRATRTLALVPAESTLAVGDSLELRGRLAVGAEWLTATATVTNRTARMVRVGVPGCSVGLQLHRGEDRAGTPAYDWYRRPNPDPDDGGTQLWGCLGGLVTFDVPPGRSIEAGALNVPVRRLLVDSLGVGTYHAAAPVYLFTSAVPIAGTRVEYRVPAGLIELRS